jgi:putative membrane protein
VALQPLRKSSSGLRNVPASMIDQAALNASLNGISAILLTLGFYFIVNGKIRQHRACMLSAFGVSTAFLISYVIYHIRVGNVRFLGQGWIRPVYFTLLISHVFLAVVILPLAIITLSRALREKFDAHKRIARWTLPLWLYVSVTGVIVYVMLYHLYPHS